MKNSSLKHFSKFHHFIVDQDHPCLMAQSVFQSKYVVYREYKGLGSAHNVRKLLKDVEQYLLSFPFGSKDFYSFIAAFPYDTIQDEKEFEEKLWKQLQLMHELDDFTWDPKVDKDPDSNHFSFSLCGHSFYIIGMHPNSSRKARRSPFPSMVFNLHCQFDQLREMNIYDNLRDRIRKRDKMLQGNINPMLTDFGEESEARQYSGRKVEKSWKCPFHHD